MDIYAEFKTRLARDVARALRHIRQSGMDVSALDGEARLVIADGALVEVILNPTPQPPPQTQGGGAEQESDAPLSPPYGTARERRARKHREQDAEDSE